MHRIDEERLLLLAMGRTGWRMRRLAAHVDRCPACRREYAVAVEAVRVGFPALARGRGWRSPAPAERSEEILSAIRAAGVRSGAGRVVRPAFGRRRRVFRIVAAAAVLLVAVATVRFLGEPGWEGRLETLRGALLLTRGDAPLEAVGAFAPIGPGDLLYAPSDARCRVEMPDGAVVEIDGPAIVGFAEGEPELRLARGFLRIRAGAAPESIETRTGPVTVAGLAEIEVRGGPPSEAGEWARRRIARDRGLLGISTAMAQSAPAADGEAPRTRVRVLAGGATVPDGRILAGHEVVIGPTGIEEACWTGTAPRPDTFRRLTPEEVAIARELLAGSEDAVATLVDAALDESRPEAVRGVAILLLGETGDRAAAERIVPIFEKGPPVLAAAAARVLVLLGNREFVNEKALLQEHAGPATPVVEALVQSFARDAAADTAGALLSVAADPQQPAYLRALSASLAAELGGPPARETLASILAAEDGPDAVRLVGRLLSRFDPDGYELLLEIARRPGAARHAAIAYLSHWGGRARGFEEEALEIVRMGGPFDPVGPALEYLAAHAPELLVEHLDRLVAEPHRRVAVTAVLPRLLRFEAARTLADELAAAPDGLPLDLRIGLSRVADAPLAARLLSAAVTTGSVSARNEALGVVESRLDEPGFATPELRQAIRRTVDDADPRTLESAWRLHARIDPADFLDRAAVLPPAGVLGGLKGLEFVAQRPEFPLSLYRPTAVFAASGARSDFPRAAEIRTTSLDVLHDLLLHGSADARGILKDLLDGAVDPAEVAEVIAVLAADPSPEASFHDFVRVIENGGAPARAAAMLLRRHAPREFVERLRDVIRAPAGESPAAILTYRPEALAEVFRTADETTAALGLFALAIRPEEIRSLAAAILERAGRAGREFRLAALLSLSEAGIAPGEAEVFLTDPDAAVRLGAAVLLHRSPAPADLTALDLRDAGGPGSLRRRLRDRLVFWEWQITGLSGSRDRRQAEQDEARSSRADRTAAQAREAIRRGLDDDAGSLIRQLADHGGRADVFLLLDVTEAGDPSMRGEAALALSHLLGPEFRTPAGEVDCAAWREFWSERAYSHDAPVLEKPGGGVR